MGALRQTESALQKRSQRAIVTDSRNGPLCGLCGFAHPGLRSTSQPVQYLLLIHRSAKSTPAPDEWDSFFSRAQASGWFRGGSAIGQRLVLGEDGAAQSTTHIAGFMRF